MSSFNSIFLQVLFIHFYYNTKEYKKIQNHINKQQQQQKHT